MDHMNGAESIDNRRKAEHLLYIQELRREDMTLKHYLVEKNWGRTWMVFRTRKLGNVKYVFVYVYQPRKL